MPDTLYFVRHGETEWNLERRMQGQLDSRLTPRGVDQAGVNARLVTALGVDGIIASPLGRVRASAAPLEGMTGLAPVFIGELMEWHAGDWSGHLHAELPGLWPEAWAAWLDDRWLNGPPGGENVTELFARGCVVVEQILARPERRLAVVSHGFVGRMMMARLLGLSREDTTEIDTPNDRVFVFTRMEAGWKARHHDAGGDAKDGITMKTGAIIA